MRVFSVPGPAEIEEFVRSIPLMADVEPSDVDENASFEALKALQKEATPMERSAARSRARNAIGCARSFARLSARSSANLKESGNIAYKLGA
jgi:hypothetical protein